MVKIVLGSASPRRQELFHRIGIQNFELRIPHVEESFPENLSPQETVAFIAEKKSHAIPSTDDEIVVTADTMVFLDNQKLGKPADKIQALMMLQSLQGKMHLVCTGVCIRQGSHLLTNAQTTKVFFRPASTQELLSYIETNEPMDKAGAYGVQGKGALLVDHIEGDFFNVMGLPVTLLSDMLSEFDIHLL